MSIVSTADNKGDTIFSDGYKVTITAGNGNDSISNDGERAYIKAGSGNDIIYNDHGAYSTIDAGAGKDWIANNDSHVSIRASADNKGDEIFNLGSNVTITAGGGKDTIENHGDKVTIKSGAGKDYIGNNGSNVKIYSTADSIGDSIFNGQIDPAYQAGGDKVTIAAGKGNDVIGLYSGESVENLLKSALTPLINAAKDYNLKKINALIDKYNSLMKNVDGFVELSQLKYSYKDKHQIELRDQLKKISSQGGSLYDELEKAEKFLGNAGVDTYKVSMMKKSVGKINKISGKAVKAIDNMEIGVGVVKEYIDDKTFQTFAKEMTSDFEKDANGRIVAAWEKDYNNPATVRAGAGKDVIYGWNLNDTLKISGGNYTGAFKGNDYVVTVGKGSVTFKNFGMRGRQQIVGVDGFERLPLQIEGQQTTGYHHAVDAQAQRLIPSPDGLSAEYGSVIADKNFSGTIDTTEDYAEDVNRITSINAVDAKNVYIVGNENINRIMSGKGKDKVHNTGSFTVIQTGAGSDLVQNFSDSSSIDAGAGSDFVLNIGDANTIEPGTGNDTILSDGGDKLIYGFGKTDTLQIGDGTGTYSATKLGDDYVVTFGKGKVSLKGAANLSKVNIAGKKKKIVSATYTDKSSAKVSLASSVQVGNGSSRTKAIQITGNKLGNTIQGGKGDDTLIGGNGNDTFNGGDGEDVFVVGTGNDFIADYEWDDKISIGASITSSTFKDSDAVFTIGKSTLTVKNGRSMNIVFIDADDTEQTIIGGAQLIDDSSSSKVKLAADVEVADASARTKKIQINGNKLDNMITGGAGNDTLSGGKGNDWLWGNAGTDTFIYGSGDGHDVICDFGNDDLLKITGTFSASYRDGEVYFKVGTTSKAITLQDFTASTFHVNDSTYKISGTKLKKF